MTETSSTSARHPFWWPAMMQGLPDLVTVIDDEGYLAYVSPSSSRLLGWPAAQLVGQRACDYIAPDDRRNSATWLRHVQTYPDAPAIVHQLRQADGAYGDFETRLRPLQQKKHSAGHVIAVSRDVSARTQVDHQLDVMVDLLRDATDIVSQGVVVVTDQGVVLAANRAAERVLGLSRDELVGSQICKHLALPFAARSSDATGHISRLPTGPTELHPVDRPSGRLRVKVVPLAHRMAGTSGCFGVLIEEIDDPACPPHPATGSDELNRAMIEARLSPRELDVLRLLTDGLDVRAISNELRISIHTTRHYVKSILRKLDVRTQVQAVAVALRTSASDFS